MCIEEKNILIICFMRKLNIGITFEEFPTSRLVSA